MTLNKVSIVQAMNNAKNALANDKTISLATKLAMELLITLLSILVARLHLNSSNSSKPPSLDPDRKKTSRKKSNRPKGGQHGHNGTTLMPVDDPDEVVDLTIDKEQLPTNVNYQENGYVARQVVDIKISRFITEYRAEILADNNGKQYIAEFPAGITRPIQYGSSVKANVTYLSAYQLIPCERLQEQFKNEYGIPISTGSICNFNTEAAAIIGELFEPIAKHALINSAVAHADETGANLEGKKIWLHNLSNDKWTWLEANSKRGSAAMDEIGIIPAFNGVLCHDHWKPYFKYGCAHSLCNAHHLRELTFAFEEDGQEWANSMKLFLLALNKEVNATQKNGSIAESVGHFSKKT
jgi:transposase